MMFNKIAHTITAAILAILIFASFADASKVYYRQGLIGGATSDLDTQDGAALSEGDAALVFYGSEIYMFYLDATSGLTESSPEVISPDTNAGTKRWVLQTVYSTTSGVAPPSGVTVRGNITGLTLSNSSTDTDNDITISPGAARDSTGAYNISSAAAMTKGIDAAWAVDTGDATPEGGLLNGTVAADELYQVYALRKDSDGSVDFGFLDQDDTIAGNLPAGYSAYRWVGYVLTDGTSAIRAFTMNQKYMIWTTAFEIVTNLNTSSLTSQDLSGFLDAGYVQQFLIGCVGNASAGDVSFSTYTEEVSQQIKCNTSATTWALALYYSTVAASGRCVGWATPLDTSAIYINTGGVDSDLTLKGVRINR